MMREYYYTDIYNEKIRNEGLLWTLQKKKMEIIDYVSCYAIYLKFKHDISHSGRFHLKYFKLRALTILTEMLF